MPHRTLTCAAVLLAASAISAAFTYPGRCQTREIDPGSNVATDIESHQDDVQLGADVGPVFFARGTYYAGTTGIWGVDDGNRLHDDGLHGDGAAGDGIFGAFVVSDQPPGLHEFKVGTEDWSHAYPTNPLFPTENALLYIETVDDLVHFRLDTSTLTDWQPAANGVSCDHFAPTGSVFELIGSTAELGSWVTGVPAVLDGDTWRADVVIASPGFHEYKFRVAGTWDISSIGIHYNMLIGDNFTFTTTAPSTALRFEFNTTDGRSRAREGVVDVSEGTSVIEPVRARLLATSPNPFNPVTSVRYEIHERTEVMLQVMDVRGRHVTTLANTVQDPGRYELRWEGRDTSGNAMASGVYWVRMTTSGGHQATTRVVLSR